MRSIGTDYVVETHWFVVPLGVSCFRWWSFCFLCSKMEFRLRLLIFKLNIRKKLQRKKFHNKITDKSISFDTFCCLMEDLDRRA